MRGMMAEHVATQTRPVRPAGPRIVVCVRDAREAAAGFARLAPDEILFEEVPWDIEECRGFRVPIQLPYAATLLARARALFPRLRVDVAGERLEERKVRLRILAGAGIVGVVSDLFTLPAGETAALLGQFLHDPSIGSPIEPAATLLASMLARRTSSLWDLCGPGLTARVFVDSRGRAAATPADLQAGRFLGARGDALDVWRASPPWRAVEEFQRNLPSSHPECLECRSFCVCQGWGAWAGACASARAGLARLAEAARVLRQAARGRQ